MEKVEQDKLEHRHPTTNQSIYSEDNTIDKPNRRNGSTRFLSQSGFKLNVEDVGAESHPAVVVLLHESVNGQVCVVDSSDTRRLTESGNEFNQLPRAGESTIVSSPSANKKSSNKTNNIKSKDTIKSKKRTEINKSIESENMPNKNIKSTEKV